MIRYKKQWLVFGTVANTAGDWSLFHTSFSDWSQAAAAPQSFLEDVSAIGPGYRAAPQVFYFAPHKKWYLVYQTGLPSYSTTDDPTKPETWSAPKNFQDQMPDIIAQNIGNGFWVDFWVVCDEKMCYLFSSDDNGHLYRSETTVADFPNGFGNTQIVLQEANRFALFEASNIYKIKGTNRYVLIVEAIGSDGRRYFRSWTAKGITGTWTPLAATESNPFARSTNVTFPDGASTRDISHGEMIRAGVDETMEIDPHCLHYLYQGMDPAAGGDYSQLPWRLGLLTQLNAGRPCDRVGGDRLAGPLHAPGRTARRWRDPARGGVSRHTASACAAARRIPTACLRRVPAHGLPITSGSDITIQVPAAQLALKRP